MSEKRIIVCEEKHSTRYWDASTDEAWASSSLAILTQRWNDGYWYHDPDKLDVQTRQWRPEAMIDLVLGDLWPGWDASFEQQQDAVTRYSTQLREKYGDDPEVLQMKLKKLKVATDEYKHRAAWREGYAEIKRVVEEQDLGFVTIGSGRWERQEPIAWQCLSARSDHEYEHVELETLEEAEVVSV